MHARRAAQTLACLPWIGRASIAILGVRGGTHEVERGAQEAADLLSSARVDVRIVEAVRDTATFDVRSASFGAIADAQPDPVAWGPRGIGGLRRMVLGSTASAVVHHAPCPVLVARVREDVD